MAFVENFCCSHLVEDRSIKDCKLKSFFRRNKYDFDQIFGGLFKAPEKGHITFAHIDNVKDILRKEMNRVLSFAEKRIHKLEHYKFKGKMLKLLNNEKKNMEDLYRGNFRKYINVLTEGSLTDSKSSEASKKEFKQKPSTKTTTATPNEAAKLKDIETIQKNDTTIKVDKRLELINNIYGRRKRICICHKKKRNKLTANEYKTQSNEIFTCKCYFHNKKMNNNQLETKGDEIEDINKTRLCMCDRLKVNQKYKVKVFEKTKAGRGKVKDVYQTNVYDLHIDKKTKKVLDYSIRRKLNKKSIQGIKICQKKKPKQSCLLNYIKSKRNVKKNLKVLVNIQTIPNYRARLRDKLNKKKTYFKHLFRKLRRLSKFLAELERARTKNAAVTYINECNKIVYPTNFELHDFRNIERWENLCDDITYRYRHYSQLRKHNTSARYHAVNKHLDYHNAYEILATTHRKAFQLLKKLTYRLKKNTKGAFQSNLLQDIPIYARPNVNKFFKLLELPKLFKLILKLVWKQNKIIKVDKITPVIKKKTVNRNKIDLSEATSKSPLVLKKGAVKKRTKNIEQESKLISSDIKYNNQFKNKSVTRLIKKTDEGIKQFFDNEPYRELIGELSPTVSEIETRIAEKKWREFLRQLDFLKKQFTKLKQPKFKRRLVRFNPYPKKTYNKIFTNKFVKTLKSYSKKSANIIENLLKSLFFLLPKKINENERRAVLDKMKKPYLDIISPKRLDIMPLCSCKRDYRFPWTYFPVTNKIRFGKHQLESKMIAVHPQSKFYSFNYIHNNKIKKHLVKDNYLMKSREGTVRLLKDSEVSKKPVTVSLSSVTKYMPQWVFFVAANGEVNFKNYFTNQVERCEKSILRSSYFWFQHKCNPTGIDFMRESGAKVWTFNIQKRDELHIKNVFAQMVELIGLRGNMKVNFMTWMKTQKVEINIGESFLPVPNEPLVAKAVEKPQINKMEKPPILMSTKRLNRVFGERNRWEQKKHKFSEVSNGKYNNKRKNLSKENNRIDKSYLTKKVSLLKLPLKKKRRPCNQKEWIHISPARLRLFKEIEENKKRRGHKVKEFFNSKRDEVKNYIAVKLRSDDIENYCCHKLLPLMLNMLSKNVQSESEEDFRDHVSMTDVNLRTVLFTLFQNYLKRMEALKIMQTLNDDEGPDVLDLVTEKFNKKRHLLRTIHPSVSKSSFEMEIKYKFQLIYPDEILKAKKKKKHIPKPKVLQALKEKIKTYEKIPPPRFYVEEQAMEIHPPILLIIKPPYLDESTNMEEEGISQFSQNSSTKLRQKEILIKFEADMKALNEWKSILSGAKSKASVEKKTSKLISHKLSFIEQLDAFKTLINEFKSGKSSIQTVKPGFDVSMKDVDEEIKRILVDKQNRTHKSLRIYLKDRSTSLKMSAKLKLEEMVERITKQFEAMKRRRMAFKVTKKEVDDEMRKILERWKNGLPDYETDSRTDKEAAVKYLAKLKLKARGFDISEENVTKMYELPEYDIEMKDVKDEIERKLDDEIRRLSPNDVNVADKLELVRFLANLKIAGLGKGMPTMKLHINIKEIQHEMKKIIRGVPKFSVLDDKETSSNYYNRAAIKYMALRKINEFSQLIEDVEQGHLHISSPKYETKPTLIEKKSEELALLEEPKVAGRLELSKLRTSSESISIKSRDGSFYSGFSSVHKPDSISKFSSRLDNLSRVSQIKALSSDSHQKSIKFDDTITVMTYDHDEPGHQVEITEMNLRPSIRKQMEELYKKGKTLDTNKVDKEHYLEQFKLNISNRLLHKTIEKVPVPQGPLFSRLTRSLAEIPPAKKVPTLNKMIPNVLYPGNTRRSWSTIYN